jgi:hypothetical protein
MKDLKIKVITGFRKEQHYTIDAEEAHKAYYLFLNPDKRGVFKNGVALIGQDIRGIEPDYHATMGWNPTYVLDSDDWNELRDKGVDRALKKVVSAAKDAAQLLPPEKMNLPLSALLPELTPPALPETKKLTDKFKI